MADYFEITDGMIDGDSPLKEEVVVALRDNPIATAEGNPDAPKNMLASLPRLLAGESVRAVLTDGDSRSDNGPVAATVLVGFTQFGTIRVLQTFTQTGVNTPRNRITRLRGGTSTVIQAFTATNPLTIDIDCIPGDLFTLDATGTTNSGGGNIDLSVTLKTDGIDLWPGEGLWGYIQGNSAAP
jgi:hypothetical protein